MTEHFDEMFQKALEARKNAYVPYVDFKVGTCIRTADNQLFVGANFQNASLPHGQCAESNAVGNMITCGKQKIIEVVIVGDSDSLSPCGGCRQQLKEFADNDTPVHLCNLNGLIKTVTMGELLPMSFSLGDRI